MMDPQAAWGTVGSITMVLDHVDVISALWKPAGGSRSPSRTCDPSPRPDHSRHALKVTKTRRDGRLLLMMTQTRNELSVSGTYCNLSQSTVRLRYSRPAGRESPECDEVQVLRFAAMIRTRNSRKCCRRRVRSVNEQQVASVQCSRATVSQCRLGTHCGKNGSNSRRAVRPCSPQTTVRF